MKIEEKGKVGYSEDEKFLFLIVFTVIIAIIAITTVVIRRKAYWKKRFKESRERTEKLMGKAKKVLRQRHDKHIEKGISYEKECEVCRGLWKD